MGMKLSGKRTVTEQNPGKIQLLGWTPKGINPDFLRNNLSGEETVGRQSPERYHIENREDLGIKD
jgi:hypothetical protein